ncbi:MAG: SHOCT domain-containing protein [Clostridia bacterium]|nr:SHOCT domain-containing protein [Clostridia bacterium]
MMHWMGFNRFGWMGGGFMMLFLPLIMGLIFYSIFRSSRRNNSTNSNRALEILDEKFALGEITEEEYLRRKKLLKE